MAGNETHDRRSQVQRPNHYTTEPPETKSYESVADSCSPQGLNTVIKACYLHAAHMVN